MSHTTVPVQTRQGISCNFSFQTLVALNNRSPLLCLYVKLFLASSRSMFTENSHLTLENWIKEAHDRLRRPGRTRDTVLVKSREMRGRTQTLPCWPGGGGGEKGQIHQQTKHTGPVAWHHTHYSERTDLRFEAWKPVFARRDRYGSTWLISKQRYVNRI